MLGKKFEGIPQPKLWVDNLILACLLLQVKVAILHILVYATVPNHGIMWTLHMGYQLEDEKKIEPRWS